MNRLFKSALLTGVFAVSLIGSANSMVAQQQQDRQGRGGDPEQFRQRMAERMRERLEVKNDEEWKLLQERIEKVMQARREVGVGGGFGGGAFGRRGGPGGVGQADANQPRRGPGGFGPEPSPEAEALQKALEGKASNDEIKAKLASLREAQKAKQASLEKAQEELRKVLTVRQEAEAVLLGLLR